MFNYDDLFQLLENNSRRWVKDWWEKYMKNVIEFRGVSIPQIKKCLKIWRDQNSLNQLPFNKQTEIIFPLFEAHYAEDKLAAVIYIQEYLINNTDWRAMLTRYSEVFGKKLIYDWNVNDWFCVRVLSPTAKLCGKECAEEIASWVNDVYLWKARSSLVGLIGLTKDKNYQDLICNTASVLIQREERFAKTAVGWVLREMSKNNLPAVKIFIKNNLEYYSKESLDNTIKYFEKPEKENIVAMFKKTNKPGKINE